MSPVSRQIRHYTTQQFKHISSTIYLRWDVFFVAVIHLIQNILFVKVTLLQCVITFNSDSAISLHFVHAISDDMKKVTLPGNFLITEGDRSNHSH